MKYTSVLSLIVNCSFNDSGDKNDGYKIKCFVEVRDIHKAVIRSDDVVIIMKPRVLDESDIKNGTDDIKRKLETGQMTEAASRFLHNVFPSRVSHESPGTIYCERNFKGGYTRGVLSTREGGRGNYTLWLKH